MARKPKLLDKVSERLAANSPRSIGAAKSRWKWGNPELAAQMAGTRDKSSREYKNAIRRVQRAEKSGKVTAEIRKILNSEAEKRAWNRARRHGVSQLSITSGRYWVSDPTKLLGQLGDGFRALDPIGGARFAPVIEALEEARAAEMTGDTAGAEQARTNANDLLEEIVSEAYEMAGGQVAHWEEVGEVDITLR